MTTTLHYLNGFTCNARVPPHWRTGTLCLLVETDYGPVLVDTGLGREDYVHKPVILRTFEVVTKVPLHPDEAAVRQIISRGYHEQDVRHIVLTHMHFDHCGGLPDFPQATVHVHRREIEAFNGRRRRWADLGYVRRHTAHQPTIVPYETAGERWFDLPAARLPFEPEMWLVPLFGHTRGHCGVALHLGPSEGWLLHVGDAAPPQLNDDMPAWMVRAVLGPHTPRLRAFHAAHPDIRITSGHMWLDFFRKETL
jgi:glyoxylase-like metal-dependent hydrolase (beta-lactamase superfamily II)